MRDFEQAGRSARVRLVVHARSSSAACAQVSPVCQRVERVQVCQTPAWPAARARSQRHSRRDVARRRSLRAAERAMCSKMRYLSQPASTMTIFRAMVARSAETASSPLTAHEVVFTCTCWRETLGLAGAACQARVIALVRRDPFPNRCSMGVLAMPGGARGT
jgi:hypothetical protein